jgi:hypothetical protein
MRTTDVEMDWLRRLEGMGSLIGFSVGVSGVEFSSGPPDSVYAR